MYRLLIKPGATKEIAKLPKPAVTRIVGAIDELGREPRPPGCKKIAGSLAEWRIRVGDYRILYEVNDQEQFVRVKKVGHRSNVYG